MNSFKSLTIDAPPEGEADWNDIGVVQISEFIPEDLISAYEQCWIENNKNSPGGWGDCTPYRRHAELLDICTYGPLAEVLENLIGEPAGVHLNLTGWVTTERDWHQDSYLNPPHVGDHYAAVWFALEDIHSNSGPFQYIAGSHRWRQVTREKILDALPPEERDHKWPKYSERILTPLFEQEISDTNSPIVNHLPKRGDILIWHGRLLHRGSRANVPGMRRKALIAHYSGIHHRQDMPPAIQSPNGGWYFPIDDLTQV